MAERSGVSDHPRSRGVYFRELWIKGLPAGSSPLARGLRRRRAVGLRRGGIIPARAGFTPRPPCRRPSRPDHPRSRGVYLLQAVMIVSFLGSSPLARGLPAALPWGMVWLGIIPARAGFTSRTRRTGRRRWDHPRSRGVYSRVTYQGSSGPGSSPLARGLPAGVHAREAAELDHPRSRGVYQPGAGHAVSSPGSSPLARGLPTFHAHARKSEWDHPRSRGVYWPGPSPRSARPGSSPLARGLRLLKRPRVNIHRIIPARAGFTGKSVREDRPRPDHPRSRGVYAPARSSRSSSRGSSPLARGLRRADLDPRGAEGIIPARAGFTTRRRRGCRRCPDHPRSRGVYPLAFGAPATGAGSSPLARGLRDHGRAGRRDVRIIPARAGFTTSLAMVLCAAAGSSPLARGLPQGAGDYDHRPRIIPARAGFTVGPTQITYPG